MRLQQEIDFTTLNWVKQELDDTLRQARQALEAYAEDLEDSSLMRFCATNLHQVQGILRMVELYGAAMVVEEMEHVAHTLIDGKILNRDDAFEALLRGTVLLPDYLERLQSGHKDIPIVLLPLLNDLRACRGEPLLSEGALFNPDLSVSLPASVKVLERSLSDRELRAAASRLRTNYQAALIKFCRGESLSVAVAEMLNAFDALCAISSQQETRRLWWAASALMDCISVGAIDTDAAVKGVFAKIDREIKRLVDTGETSFRTEPPDELLKSLLYYIAQSKFSEGRVGQIKQLYRLDQLVASEQEVEQARDALVGRNRAVLDTVAGAIKEDLMRVKDALDLFLRTATANVGDLAPQVEVLDRVSDTLGVLGVGVPRRVVLEQREALNKMVIGQALIAENSLLEIAGALLFVESSLDDHIERLSGADNELEPIDSAVESDLELPQAEVRKILDSLMKEVQTNLIQIKHDVVAFIESGWEHGKAEQIPRLMDEIAGAMRMINLSDASVLLAAMSKFIEIELLQRKRVPTADQMDRLADAVASMEFYLEAAHAQRVGREHILDVTRESLAALGYWPESEISDALTTAESGPPVSAPTPSDPRIISSGGISVSELESAFSNLEVDMTSLSFANDAVAADDDRASSNARFREHEITDASLPAVDLPASTDFGKFIDQVGNGEPGRILLDDETTDEPSLLELEQPLEPQIELRSAIEILLDDDAETSNTDNHDSRSNMQTLQHLDGLMLAETQSSRSDQNTEEFEVEWVEVAQEIIEEPKPVTANTFQLAASVDIDEGIREVFLEEVQEEIENLGRVFPIWKSALSDFEKLKPIRRSFHTMKGSGRLVGAVALGEFSWKVENMLNRVLDRTIPSSPAVIALLDHALEALPQLLSGLRGEPAAATNIAGIMETADKLASGEEAWLPLVASGRRTKLVRIPVKKFETHKMDVVDEAIAAELTEPFDITRPMLESVPTETPVHLLSPVQMPIPEEPNSTLSGSELVDPMMLEILRTEVAGHLHVIFSYLGDCAKAEHALLISEELLRTVHTMHGAIAMVEIPSLAPLIGPLEGYLKRLRGVNAAPTEIGLTAIADAAQAIETDIAAVDQPNATKTDNIEIVERLRDLRAQLPEPESLAGVFNLALPEDEDDENYHQEDRHDISDKDLKGIVTTNSDEAKFEVEGADEEFETPEEWDVESVDASGLPTNDQTRIKDLSAEEISLFSAELAELAESLSKVEPITGNSNLLSDSNLVTELDNAAASVADKFIYQPIAEDNNPDSALELLDMDEDLLDIFVQEGNDILDVADTMMSRLRGVSPEREIILNLQRELHTLKGGARMAGLAPIGDLSHVMESLLENVADGRQDMNRLTLESLERGFDRLHGLVARVGRRQAIGMPYNAIARFEDLVAGKEIPFLLQETTVPASNSSFNTETLVAAQPSKIEDIEAPTDPVPTLITNTPSVKPKVRDIADEDTEEFARPQHEMIRVRSDLLDNLVNYAGEVSIYRSRLEQQMATFRFSLQELDQTVFRLREQLRKLELETEAQIIARYQREAEESALGGFDPLELDRFSTLQQLTRALAESASDLLALQATMEDLTKQSETLLLQQSRVSSELQEGLMRTRMVPFDSVVPRLRRLMRQIAGELGKRAQLRVEGAQGEMDRNVLDRMTAPLEHMLRNALAHGMETPAERLAIGKPEEGAVTIRISREATEVVIKVSDDGKGMDRDAIRRKALERGLLKEGAQLSDRDLFGFVLETGFSTAESVSKIAGRGVGMDVVNSEIKQLGGSLSIDSTRGAGTEFIIRLPFTLAVTQAILIRLGENLFAIPMSSVQGVVRIRREDFDERLRSYAPIYSYGGDDYHIYELTGLLDMPLNRATDDTQLPLLMTRSGDQRAAVRVDAVLGSREIVVKSVGPQISSVPGIFGATIMGDGSVVMILDMAPLVRRHAALKKSTDDTVIEKRLTLPVAFTPDEALRPLLVMVVDDSITMRKVTSRVLERNDMMVVTAKDGLDAVEKLQGCIPDLMLLDIEMPRMDGYELATYMRNDSRLKRIPIIMITSRTGEKHRQRALDIGIDRYLGKPYQETDLLKNVDEILRLSRVIQ